VLRIYCFDFSAKTDELIAIAQQSFMQKVAQLQATTALAQSLRSRAVSLDMNDSLGPSESILEPVSRRAYVFVIEKDTDGIRMTGGRDFMIGFGNAAAHSSDAQSIRVPL
jgi:hypothetical protein